MRVSPKQQKIETYMQDRAISRFRASTSRAVDSRRESESTSAKYLLEDAFGKFLAEVDETMKKSAGQKTHLQMAIQELKPSEVAAVAIQAIMDGLSTGGRVGQISGIVGEALENEERMRLIWGSLESSDQGKLKRLVGRRVAPSLLARTLTKMQQDGEEGEEPEYPRWTRGLRMGVGYSLICLFVESTALMEFHLVTGKGRGKRKTTKYIVPTLETVEWLERSDAMRELLHPYFMPCVDKPVPWKKGSHYGGYNLPYLELVKVNGNRSDKIADTEMGRVRTAVNFLQGTPWSVNTDVLEVYRHCFEEGWEVEGVAPKAEIPIPEKPDVEGMEEEAAEDLLKPWRSAKYLTFVENIQRRGERLKCSRILWMADTYANEDRFYFPWTCDFRGRVYPTSSSLQPQGSMVERGILQFADTKRLGTEAAERWFLIHGANSWGEDKGSFDARVSWVTDHHAEIMRVYHDPLSTRWWTEADRPWEFLAWCLEYGDYARDGLNHQSGIAIGMDGSNNGLQIYSLLLRDPVCAASTNCVPVDEPQDIYQDVADLVFQEMQEATEGPGCFWAEIFSETGLSRKAVKRPVMTYAYGVTKYSSSHYVREWLREERENIHRYEEINKDHLQWLYNTVWDKIQVVVSSAKECMEWLQDCARLFNAHAGREITWKSPSDFPVMPRYAKRRQRRVQLRTKASVSQMNYREDMPGLDTKRHVNSIAPNFVHSLDAAALVATVEISRVEGVTHLQMIHDSFGTHAADAPTLATALRQAYTEIFTPDLLEDFHRQLQEQAPPGVTIPPPPHRGTLEVSGLSGAEYFFA